MAKNSVEAYGAEGKSNVLFFKPGALTLIGLDTKDDEKHELYDETVHDDPPEFMVKSVAKRGVLEPIVIRKNGETGAIEVEDGRTRVKSARMAIKLKMGLAKDPDTFLIPAVIKRADANEAFDVMVALNEHRQDKSPIVRARLMKRALDRGVPESDLPDLFKCSVSTVKNMLALLDAPAAVKKAVDRGDIGAAEAYKLAALPPAEAKERLPQVIAAKGNADETNGSSKPKRKKGRTKRGQGKKVREALTGGKAIHVRPGKEIKEELEKMKKSELIKEDVREGVIAAFKFVLGASHEEAFKALEVFA